MKKLLCALLAALTLLASVVPAMAVDESQSYLFELSIDGSDTKQAAPGDIVTVALALKRTTRTRATPCTPCRTSCATTLSSSS